MQRALILAQKAADAGEVPVGALITIDNQCVSESWNQPICQHDPTAHAEILALRQATAAHQNYRLLGATLYVTLEPCMMCVGAMIHARIDRLVFGAPDPKTGAVATVMPLLEAPMHNHTIKWEGGVLADECGDVLRRFFRERRV